MQATLGVSFDIALDAITSYPKKTLSLFFFRGNASSLYGNAPPAAWTESMIADAANSGGNVVAAAVSRAAELAADERVSERAQHEAEEHVASGAAGST